MPGKEIVLVAPGGGFVQLNYLIDNSKDGPNV
jgi:hypothetical protein